jgi:hypothetical protein
LQWHVSPVNLQVNISNKQILSIALPITAAIIVPQMNFIINNIFLGGLGQKRWRWRASQVCIISFLRWWAMG